MDAFNQIRAFGDEDVIRARGYIVAGKADLAKRIMTRLVEDAEQERARFAAAKGWLHGQPVARLVEAADARITELRAVLAEVA